MEDNVIVMHDAEGNEEAFEFLDLIIYEDKEYVVLEPKDAEDLSIVIMQLESVDEEQGSLIPVTDEKVMEKLAEFVAEKFKDEFQLEV